MSTFLLFALLKLICDLTGSAAVCHWAQFVNDAAPVVVGLSFIGLAYAVVKYRVFGIRLAIRQGLRYLGEKRVTVDHFSAFSNLRWKSHREPG